jgi:hypothetical protein
LTDLVDCFDDSAETSAWVSVLVMTLNWPAF